MTFERRRTLRGVEDLEDLFREHAPRVHAYASRHVGPDQADDVVSEVFLVAWRRRDDIPRAALPWLLVVARHTIANQRRTGRRADQLWMAVVREQWHSPEHLDPAEAVLERDLQLRALASCTRPEREALLLVAWDGLTPAQGAAVVGCSTRAFTVRLSRGRARMRSALATSSDNPHPTFRLVEETS